MNITLIACDPVIQNAVKIRIPLKRDVWVSVFHDKVGYMVAVSVKINGQCSACFLKYSVAIPVVVCGEDAVAHATLLLSLGFLTGIRFSRSTVQRWWLRDYFLVWRNASNQIERNENDD